MWTSQNYHDLHLARFSLDVVGFDKAVYAALKPGGVFFIEDHAAKDGSGLDAPDKLHRIDEAVVKQEVESAGFKLVGESDILRNPADDRTLAGLQSGHPRPYRPVPAEVPKAKVSHCLTSRSSASARWAPAWSAASLGSGQQVVAFDVSAAALAKAGALGCETAASAEAAVAGAATVITMLPAGVARAGRLRRDHPPEG